MAYASKLSSPPIREALVDLRIQTTEPVTASTLEAALQRLGDDYPQSDVRHRFETTIETKHNKPPTAISRDLGFHGFFSKHRDGSRIIQLRNDGFTFNLLKGYQTGEELLREALDLWGVYAAAVHPTAVARIALRYINTLTLSFAPGDELTRFLMAPVSTPTGTPQSVIQFLSRTVIEVDDRGTNAIVTQQLGAGPVGTAPFTLDLDVFRADQFSGDRSVLLPLFEELRLMKNRLFFGYLTDEALEPYR